jgi:cell division septation protein DedD
MATATQDDGFHEIQLNGKQLVFLFMAGTVVAVVIFLLGVFVGRGVRAEIGQTAQVAAAELPAATPPDVPPAVSTGTDGPPPTTREELTYAQRLGSAEPPREVLRDAPATPPADAPAASPAPPPAAPVEPRTDPAPSSSPATGAPPAATVPGEPTGEGFAIQVAALAKRDEAETIARRLVAKGYPAYVMAPASGAPSVFRVRVGKFKDRREAESLSTRLQKEEQFKPWIVR